MEDLVNDLMVAIMMINGIRMKLEVAVRTRGKTIPIVFMINTIEIKEEEVEDKDLEEEASVKNCFHCVEEVHRAFECSQYKVRTN